MFSCRYEVVQYPPQGLRPVRLDVTFLGIIGFNSCVTSRKHTILLKQNVQLHEILENNNHNDLFPESKLNVLDWIHRRARTPLFYLSMQVVAQSNESQALFMSSCQCSWVSPATDEVKLALFIMPVVLSDNGIILVLIFLLTLIVCLFKHTHN